MNLGLLSRAKIGAYCSMIYAFAQTDIDLIQAQRPAIYIKKPSEIKFHP